MEFPVNQSRYEFLRDKHIKYCKRWYGILPEACESLDANRIVTAFFAISSLDHLGALDKVERDSQELIDWIYFMQVTPNEEGPTDLDFGFRGSTLCTTVNNLSSELSDKAHITMTYTALSTLLILGDDLSRVNKRGILKSLGDLQLPDGSFRPMNINCESDMRFVYCAACVCYILKDWSTINTQKLVEYIMSSINYDGGIGQGPGLESHGGSTFCAIATLYLMGKLKTSLTSEQLKRMKRWLVFRQDTGFHGRPNKPDDTCYTFWIGATLKILDCYEFVNYPVVSEYVFSAQNDLTGGIAKCPGPNYSPDIMHTYLGLSGLMLQDKGTPLIHPALNISHRAASKLSKIEDRCKLI